MATDPDPAGARLRHVAPYPYAARSVPLSAAGRRFGALTALRPETYGTYRPAEHTELQRIGEELARVLARLAASEGALTAGATPMPVSFGSHADTTVRTPGRGPVVAGSAGTGLMHPARRLAGLLNQATAEDDILAAARHCVTTLFRARAVVQASADEGRLWVLGHSGASADPVRDLHGTGPDARTPAAETFLGRPLFCPGGRQAVGGAAGRGEHGGRARPGTAHRRDPVRITEQLPQRPRQDGLRGGARRSADGVTVASSTDLPSTTSAHPRSEEPGQ